MRTRSREDHIAVSDDQVADPSPAQLERLYRGLGASIAGVQIEVPAGAMIEIPVAGQ